MEITTLQNISCACFILNEKHEVLLIHHPRMGWSPPQGIVQKNETLIESCKRQARQQTNINMRALTLIDITDYPDAVPTPDSEPISRQFDFYGIYLEGEIKGEIKNGYEREVKWVTLSDAFNMINHPDIHERFLLLKKHLERQEQFYRVRTANQTVTLVLLTNLEQSNYKLQ